MTESHLAKKPEISTAEIISQTFASVVSGLTGILSSDSKERILSIGHVLQRLRAGNFLGELMSEWNKYVDKGQIKPEYEKTEQHFTCLQEMLDFLDKDIPDQVRFTTLKKIFFAAAVESNSTRDSILPFHYMKIMRSLSTGAVQVLLAAYAVSKTTAWKKEIGSAGFWLKTVAKESQLEHPDLVEVYEKELILNCLVSPRTYTDRSGITLGQSFRLTPLAVDLCKFIESYSPPQE